MAYYWFQAEWASKTVPNALLDRLSSNVKPAEHEKYLVPPSLGVYTSSLGLHWMLVADENVLPWGWMDELGSFRAQPTPSIPMIFLCIPSDTWISSEKSSLRFQSSAHFQFQALESLTYQLGIFQSLVHHSQPHPQTNNNLGLCVFKLSTSAAKNACHLSLKHLDMRR